MSVRNPLVGFNDNVEHRGHTYHIQTEDSAGRRCNVITHLFADGGRIVTSSKSSYKDYAEEPNADERVRELMREQHRAMLLALQAGTYDELLTAVTAPAAPVPPPQPSSASRDPTPRAPIAALPDQPALAARPAVQPPPRASAAPELAGHALPPLGGARDNRAAAAIDRRATPSSAGAYRFVGEGSALPNGEEAATAAPPRKRRYPQTNPGRVRPSAHSLAAAQAVAAAMPPGFPSSTPFGSETPMTQRLDELIVAVIAELRSS